MTQSEYYKQKYNFLLHTCIPEALFPLSSHWTSLYQASQPQPVLQGPVPRRLGTAIWTWVPPGVSRHLVPLRRPLVLGQGGRYGADSMLTVGVGGPIWLYSVENSLICLVEGLPPGGLLCDPTKDGCPEVRVRAASGPQ